MKQKVADLIANLKSITSSFDIAYEYEDFIGGKFKPPHEEIVTSGILMMAVLDARYTLYRIIQFINLSDAGELIQVDNAETRHMVYIRSIFPQIVQKESEIVSTLEQVVNNKVLFSEGKPITLQNAEPVQPILDEQLQEFARHSQIATTTAEKIRKGRNQ